MDWAGDRHKAEYLRVPSDADQRFDLMAITIPKDADRYSQMMAITAPTGGRSVFSGFGMAIGILRNRDRHQSGVCDRHRPQSAEYILSEHSELARRRCPRALR
jgi:hypothetical protein